jgi:hypothetical protein
MKLRRFVPLLFIVAATGCHATADERGDVFLVDATLESVSQIQGTTSDSAPNEVPIGGPLRQTFRVKHVLVGSAPEGRLTLDFERQGWPATGGDYFLIVQRTTAGPKTVWWRTAVFGLCVDKNTAAQYDLIDSIRRLQTSYRCTDQPWNYVK